jgi:hypothetical protein
MCVYYRLGRNALADPKLERKMVDILFWTLVGSPFLLVATYIMTLRTKSFKKIFIAHTILFIAYMTFVVNYSKLITGHDEYGLGQLGLGILFIIIHIVLGFIHGIYLTIKNRKLQ